MKKIRDVRAKWREDNLRAAATADNAATGDVEGGVHDMRANPFTSLPPEIYLEIFKHLSLVLPLRLVCHHWKSLADNLVLPSPAHPLNVVRYQDAHRVAHCFPRTPLYVVIPAYVESAALKTKRQPSHDQQMQTPTTTSSSTTTTTTTSTASTTTTTTSSSRDHKIIRNDDDNDQDFPGCCDVYHRFLDVRCFAIYSDTLACHPHPASYFCPRLRDVSALSNVSHIEISDADFLTDVSPLQNVPHIKLSRLYHLVDISSLGAGGVHTLELIQCHSVYEVHSLTGVRELRLHNLIGVRQCSLFDLMANPNALVRTLDVSGLSWNDGNDEQAALALPHLHTLEASGSSFLSDLSLLLHLTSIDLSDTDVHSVEEFAHASCLEHLNISHTHVNDLRPLAGVHTVIASGCAIDHLPRTTEHRGERGKEHGQHPSPQHRRRIHTLNISSSHGPVLLDLSPLSHLHTLDCSRTHVTDVSALGTLHSINLSACTDLVDVSALSGVHRLNLSYCTLLEDVSVLTDVHTLVLDGCGRVSDIASLSNVSCLSIDECPLITDMSMLQGVATLILPPVVKAIYECCCRTYSARGNRCVDLDLGERVEVLHAPVVQGGSHPLWKVKRKGGSSYVFVESSSLSPFPINHLLVKTPSR